MLSISEVIDLLTRIKEKHGDLIVEYSHNDNENREIYCGVIESDFKVREGMGVDGANSVVINPFQTPLISPFKEIK